MMKVSRKKRQRGDIVGALDIGTHKISAAIAEHDVRQGDEVTLLGVGQQGSRGINCGAITDMDALQDAILNAVHTAEQKAGQTIDGLYISLPANCVKSSVVSVNMDIGSEPISTEHLQHLLALGQKTERDHNHHVLHAIPLNYTVDDQDNVRDPKGMFCNKMSARIHMLHVPQTFLRNISVCVGRCHLNIKGFVVSSYAAGLATLVDDELELGVSIVDVGGSATTIASFMQGTLVYLASVPLGGQSITRDIARGLSTSMSQAERLKTLYGSISPLSVLDSTPIEEREHIIVPQLGEDAHAATHQVPKSFLLQVIRARVEEIFEHVGMALDQSPLGTRAHHRIVLTGGGSQMPGLSDFLTHQWSCSVRLGRPSSHVSGAGDYAQNPGFSTCFGLIQYGVRDEDSYTMTSLNGQKYAHGDPPLWTRFLRWFKENF